MARRRETQPDILEPERTRPAKPASPATVPLPGKGLEEERKEPAGVPGRKQEIR